MFVIDIVKTVENSAARSAWARGVKVYALEMLDAVDVKEFDAKTIEKVLLNGAENWDEYSYGGSSLIYDADIAERLCTPSELKKTKGGERNPNSRENWLDVQTRALCQACNIIERIIGACND